MTEKNKKNPETTAKRGKQVQDDNKTKSRIHREAGRASAG
jgi:hypothetical protein